MDDRRHRLAASRGLGGARLILIDTHIWIWSNSEPEKTPERLVPIIESQEIAISSISLVETLTAMQKGRVGFTTDPESTVRFWLRQNPVRVISIDSEIAMLSRTLQFDHPDPADRLIGATAYAMNLPLATLDENLLKLPWLKTV